MAYGFRGEALYLQGFTEMQRSLDVLSSASDFGVEYELQRRLRIVGQKVASDAPHYVTHRDPDHHTDGPTLEDSVRVSVTKSKLSVYSTAPHGGVQNVGGFPKGGPGARGPHVQRGKASRWMIRAVEANKEFTRRQVEGTLDWLVDEYNRGI